ncbi:hypothetical protein NKG94_45475 [Micromonospora sp. M12]
MDATWRWRESVRGRRTVPAVRPTAVGSLLRTAYLLTGDRGLPRIWRSRRWRRPIGAGGGCCAGTRPRSTYAG